MGLSADSATEILDLGNFGEMGLIPPKKWTPSLADKCLPHRERGCRGSASLTLGESRRGDDPLLLMFMLKFIISV